MNPVTHFFVGWSALEKFQVSHRDRALVVLAGLAPDLDGLGIVIDFVTRNTGLPDTGYYQAFHRMYGHGLPAAIVFSIIVALLADSKLRAGIFAFISVHLHFISDLLGSRGTQPEDIWPIYYFAPFDDRWSVAWKGQWPLVSWQNTTITVILLALTFALAINRGYTPLAIFSVKGDNRVMDALRKRWNALRRHD